MINTSESPAKLFVCATPIGNLKDITLRAIETLSSVDLIAAEDTRKTVKLLNHFNIKKPIQSYKGFEEKKSAEKYVNKIREGRNVALVSDAGLPGISDPGYKLITACIENDIEIEVIPGPSAFTTALVYSGLPTDKFIFEGFLPPKEEQRKKRLVEIAGLPATIVLFESPKRLLSCLRTIHNVLGDRKIAVARELTKKFEEILRGKTSEIIAGIETREIKGEVVVVIEGSDSAEVADSWIASKLDILFNMGLSKKDATKILSSLYKIRKNRVYRIAEQMA